MKKALYLSISALVLVAALAALHSQHRPKAMTIEREPAGTESAKPHGEAKETQTPQSHNSTGNEQFEQRLQQESLKIAQLDSDPEKTQRDLELFSEQLSDVELNLLKDKVTNSVEDGDARSLAVYLLSLSKSDAALDLMKDIALSPLPATKNDRLLTFEEALRAATIDGFVRHPNKDKSLSILHEISQKTESRLVADRSRRAYESRKNNLPTPEIQEQDALRKLVGDKAQ